MVILSSEENLAGYKAVVEYFAHFEKAIVSRGVVTESGQRNVINQLLAELMWCLWMPKDACAAFTMGRVKRL